MLAVVLFAPLARAASRAFAWWLARLLSWAVVVGVVLVSSATPARADEAPPVLDPAVLESVRALALGKADNAGQAGAPRIEVTVGQLDPRLHLAPCQSIEPYVPAGMRLWGKARIGLRCKVGPIPWNVYLPVTVKVWGRALVVPAGAAAGATLSSADLAEAEVDLAEEFTPALVDPKLAVGRVLAQNLKPGQTLRAAHLKIRQWFVAGDTVKVLAQGEGFSLESEAQALSNGVEGQSARVRTESGHVLTGMPSGERRIEVTL